MTTGDHQQPPRRRSKGGQVGSPQPATEPHQFLRNKKQEWEEYRSEVTAFELRKNLPVL
ncbi:glutamine synthetase [Streptomyces sp. SID14478]|uniref:glutamine synthetase n=1 Tax=Streptomyces sp. SID14478 TaxID=2706073 RepID=UPI001EF200F5|nr:glutamine synthetase [Streptomyces sp. SID14478]